MIMSKDEFPSLSGIGHETLEVWIEQEWLIPRGSSVEPNFSNIDIARARLIRELLVDFGVNSEGVGVILNLVDQLYSVRRTLTELRHAVCIGAEQR
jgi:chaperone modulatory protein CbpM